MKDEKTKQNVIDFFKYPPVGADDWRYTYQTAQVRALEIRILAPATLGDMANAVSFEEAVELLAATEYAAPQAEKDLARVEKILRQRRAELRRLFEMLCLDEPIVELFKSRDDFANLRLALRRTLTDKPVGDDYSSEGNIEPQRYAQVFENRQSEPLPEYAQRAVEQAVLEYYRDKDIRRIDYAIDSFQADYCLDLAQRLENLFLLGLFRIQIDLTNIRTMLRLKFSGSPQRNVFLHGGYVELERLEQGLETGYESLAQWFYHTPYHNIVETGSAYLAAENSFLKLEQQSDLHLIGYLKTTAQIAAGPQPVIAYLLMKENEIRNLRFILTAKKNNLDTRLILDRIAV